MTLHLYVARRFFVTYLVVTLSVVLFVYAVSVVNLLGRFDKASEIPLWRLVQLNGYVTITVVERVFPLLVLFAACGFVLRFHQRLELGACRASGLSLRRILLGIMAVAMGLGVFQATVLNPVSSWASNEYDSSELGYIGSLSNTIGHSDGDIWIRQLEEGGGVTFISAASGQRVPLILRGVNVIELDETGELVRSVSAPRARLEAGFWRLDNAVVAYSSGESAQQESVQIANNIELSHLETRELLNVNADFWQLPYEIEQARRAGINPRRLETRWHSLTARPVFAVTMVLVAVGLCAFCAPRQSSFPLLVYSILAGASLFMLDILCEALGQAGALSPVVAVWVPVSAALFASLTVVTSRDL